MTEHRAADGVSDARAHRETEKNSLSATGGTVVRAKRRRRFGGPAYCARAYLARPNRHGFSLRPERELDGEKRVILRHGALRTLQAIENELAEERKSDAAVHGDVSFASSVDEVDVIPFGVATHVEVFAELDVTIGAHDERSTV